MSDTVKLIIEMPKKDYEFTKGAETARHFRPEYYVKLILNGIPLDEDLESLRAEVRAYFNGQAYGWERGRKALIEDLRAEIEQNAYPIVHGVNNHEKGMTLYGILQVLDNIDNVESEDI